MEKISYFNLKKRQGRTKTRGNKCRGLTGRRPNQRGTKIRYNELENNKCSGQNGIFTGNIKQAGEYFTQNFFDWIASTERRNYAIQLEKSYNKTFFKEQCVTHCKIKEVYLVACSL